jgi:hypothetical protein
MEILTTTITNTLSYAPTVALLTLNDPYHTTVAITATFTVGDVWLFFVMSLLLVVEVVRLVKQWRR